LQHLPVEQATKIELIIDLKTAKALGLAVLPSILLRADSNNCWLCQLLVAHDAALHFLARSKQYPLTVIHHNISEYLR
jgi:hypothetical protein